MPEKEIEISIGNKFKQLRIEKGFTLEDVHKKTKIHPNILRAIEEDRISSLSPVYVKGFLKIYCQFLGINPEEVIKDYKEVRTRVEVVKKKEEKGQESVLHPEPILKQPLFKMPSLKVMQKAGVIIAAIVAIFFVIKLGKFVAFKISQIKSRPRPERVVEKTKEKAKVKVEAESKPKASSAPVKESAVSASSPSLGIHAKDNCWMQVKSDGKVVFQGILKKGRSEAWTAKDKIEVSLNNAGVVDLEINGKLIPPVAKKGQAVKRILITREGMNITR